MEQYEYHIGDRNIKDVQSKNGLFAAAIQAAKENGDSSEVTFVAGGVGSGLYRSKNGMEIHIYHKGLYAKYNSQPV